MSVPGRYAIDGDDAALLDRVRKLMDKASATSNEHEAEAFSAKAAELVARHRLDPDRLRAARSVGELAVHEVPVGRGAYVRARLALLTAVAEAHDAKVVFGATPTGTVAYVAGVAADLAVVEVMYQSLHAQAAARMAELRSSTPAATTRYRRSFLLGFAERIGPLLGETRASVEADARASTSGSSDLSLQDRRERIDEFVVQSFGKVRTARAVSPPQVAGWSAGMQAAERADVGRARLRSRRAIGPG